MGVRISLPLQEKKEKKAMRIVNYVKESYKELVEKVSWPKFPELQSSTIVVMIASLLFAIVVLVMDMSFENIMKFIYAQ